MKSFSFSCLGTTFQCKGLLGEDVLKTFFGWAQRQQQRQRDPIYLAGVLWPVTYAHWWLLEIHIWRWNVLLPKTKQQGKRAPLLWIKSCIKLCFVLCAEYRVDAEFSLSTRTFYRLVWTQEAFMRSRHYSNFMLHEASVFLVRTGGFQLYMVDLVSHVGMTFAFKVIAA